MPSQASERSQQARQISYRYLGPAGLPAEKPLAIEVPSAPVRDARREAEELCRTMDSLRSDAQRERLELLLPRLHRWWQHLDEQDDADLLGALALAHIAQEGLYLSLGFCSRVEFIQSELQAVGRGDSESRVSRLCTTAEFWREIWAAGLPTPAKLTTLDDLAPKPDRLTIYRALTQKHRAAPTAAQIKRELIRRGLKKNGGPEQVRYQVKELSVAAVAALDAGNVARARELLIETQQWVTPPFRPRKHKGEVEVYDPAWGCPVNLEVRGLTLIVTVTPQLPKSVRAKAWDYAPRHGWVPLANAAGWEVSLNPHVPDWAWADAHQVLDFFIDACDLAGTPLPELKFRQP